MTGSCQISLSARLFFPTPSTFLFPSFHFVLLTSTWLFSPFLSVLFPFLWHCLVLIKVTHISPDRDCGEETSNLIVVTHIVTTLQDRSNKSGTAFQAGWPHLPKSAIAEWSHKPSAMLAWGLTSYKTVNVELWVSVSGCSFIYIHVYMHVCLRVSPQSCAIPPITVQ